MLSSLRVRIVLLVAVAALPSFALILFIAVEQRERERDAASENAVRYAETISLQMESSVASIEEQLVSLSRNPVVQNRDVDGCNALVAGIPVSFPAYKDAYFFAADMRGDVYCAGFPPDPNEATVNITDRGYFQRVLATEAFATGEYQVGRITGVANIAFAAPVFQDGKMVAVVLATVPLEVLGVRVAEVQLPEGSVYRLLDREGTVLSTNLDAERWVGENVSQSGLEPIIGGETGSAEGHGLDDKQRLYGFTPVGDTEAAGLTLIVGIPTGVAYGAIDRDLIRNLSLLALVAGLGMCAAWYGTELFVGKQTRRLVNDVQHYAVGETSKHSPKDHGGVSELTDLHNAFDSLASVVDLRDVEREEAARELEEANTQLERRVADRTLQLNERNQRLEQEIEQRKAVEAELERFAVQVSRTNTDLEEFTYAVSHDLKAPLRGISGFASMVLEDNSESLNESARENLTVVMQSAEQMRRLIDDLLSLSRIARTENGHSDISMLDEVREVESEMAYVFKEKGIVLKIAEDLPVIHSGPVRVKQILRNLISNAVKYGDDAKPVIEVGWQQDNPASYTFFVRDNGKGIDTRFHDRIFGIFQRLDPRLETEGTGIGLTICKKAIESLDGRIWVESEPSAGSTFYFSLPITNVEVTHQPAPDPARGRQSA